MKKINFLKEFKLSLLPLKLRKNCVKIALFLRICFECLNIEEFSGPGVCALCRVCSNVILYRKPCDLKIRVGRGEGLIGQRIYSAI